MNWDHPKPFTRALVPAPDDIDGLNHTNNAVYVQWCERTAWAHSEMLGLSLADYRRLDRAMAIRHADYDYLLPTQLSETLTLATWLTASDGKLTMERRFQLVRDRDQATVLRGPGAMPLAVALTEGLGRTCVGDWLQRQSDDLIRALSSPLG